MAIRNRPEDIEARRRAGMGPGGSNETNAVLAIPLSLFLICLLACGIIGLLVLL